MVNGGSCDESYGYIHIPYCASIAKEPWIQFPNGDRMGQPDGIFYREFLGLNQWIRVKYTKKLVQQSYGRVLSQPLYGDTME